MAGREQPIAEVLAALRSEGRVVVVGTGGVGKSTLARHIAEQFGAEDVVWLDVDRLLAGQSLGPLLVDSVGDRSLSREPQEVQLHAVTEGRHLMIVLDGADGNVDEAIRLTDAIPTTGRGPWVVVTSRVRPTDGAAVVVRLAPLDVAAPDGWKTAAELFRVSFVRAGGAAEPPVVDAALDRILPLTGGVPLALRVTAAAAAASGLDAAEAALATGGGFADLQRCIDRSVAPLSAIERAVFDAIAVTAGWVEVDDATAVSGVSRDEVVTALGSLVRHSLLELEASGYRMLPPVHRFAVTRVSDATELWDRCHAWCESMMDDQARLLRHEQDVRIVVGRLLDSPDHDDIVAATALTQALAWAQFDSLLQHVAAEYLRSVLAAAALRDVRAIDQRIELLRLLAIAEVESQGIAAALSTLDEADRLVPSATNPDYASARLMSLRGVFLHDAGSVEDGLDMAQRAGASARSAGDRFNEVQSGIHQAQALQDLGRLAEADEMVSWVADACDDTMASFAQRAQSTRALVAFERGDRALCEALGRKQLTEAASLGEAIDAEYLLMLADPLAQSTRLTAVREIDPSRPGEWMVYLEAQASLAMQALVAGEHDRATTIGSDIVVVAEALPMFWMRLEGLLLVGDAALASGSHRQAWLTYRTAMTLANTYGYATRLADAIDGLARLTIAGDDRRMAFDASDAIRAACDADRRPRPWLPALPIRRSRAAPALPEGWVTDRALSEAAINAILSAAEKPATGDEPSVGRLSPAEMRVARLVAQGCTNREIGERLHIARRTVETHIVHAFQKLAVQNRTQLATAINNSDADSPIA